MGLRQLSNKLQSDLRRAAEDFLVARVPNGIPGLRNFDRNPTANQVVDVIGVDAGGPTERVGRYQWNPGSTDADDGITIIAIPSRSIGRWELQIDASLDPVASNVAQNTADIATLQTDVGTLQTDVGTLQTDVGTLQTDVGTNTTNIGTNTTNIGTNTTNIGNNTTAITNLQNDKVDRAGDTMSGALTITAGGLQVDTGGVNVDGGGIDVDGAATLRTLSVPTGGVDVVAGGLTVQADGADITGASSVTGTLDVTGQLGVEANIKQDRSGDAADAFITQNVDNGQVGAYRIRTQEPVNNARGRFEYRRSTDIIAMVHEYVNAGADPNAEIFLDSLGVPTYADNVGPNRELWHGGNTSQRDPLEDVDAAGGEVPGVWGDTGSSVTLTLGGTFLVFFTASVNLNPTAVNNGSQDVEFRLLVDAVDPNVLNHPRVFHVDTGTASGTQQPLMRVAGVWLISGNASDVVKVQSQVGPIHGATAGAPALERLTLHVVRLGS